MEDGELYMKKIIGRISWILAIIGVGILFLAGYVLDDPNLLCIGIGLLVVGSIGALVTREKALEVILKLLDFI